MKWTREEYELVDLMYDDQCTYEYIADQCNQDFHGGQKVRTINSISYALDKLYKENILDSFED